jgi:hypothetical protein
MHSRLDGLSLLEVTISELHDRTPPPTMPRSDGALMLKYVPCTGAWGEADVHQVTLTPAGDPDRTIERLQAGVGTVRFHRSRLVRPSDHASCRECPGGIIGHRAARWFTYAFTGRQDVRDQRALM